RHLISMTDVVTTDIFIAGAGPTAFAAASECAASGFSVILAAPTETPLQSDARTTALMMPGVGMLQDFGVWDDLAEKATAMKTLRIVDATGRLLRAPTVDFRASEAGEEQFGYNIPNLALNRVLREAVENNGTIEVIDAMASAIAFNENNATATLSNGTQVEAKLVVGADGVQSLVRNAAEIGERNWAYPQTAVVTAFDHEKPHGGVSTEFHTVDGPFTQVPLQGNRSSLVWVTKPDSVSELTGLDADSLSMRIERNLQHMLGKISNVAPLQPWPLSTMVANRFGGERVMLVGHAAHAFPPTGAQGLNLGFRDIEDLGAVLSEAHADSRDPGAWKTTRAYDRRRRADVYLRTGAVDALNRSLLNGFLPVQAVRSIGMSALKNAAPLRSFFMREGIQPGSGMRGLFG
ncbi:MAG: UbiH/UbiF family hydroxylase, partial [Pseudomonadota bacterium]